MQADDILADLMDRLRVEMPGADDPVMFLALRDTLRILCRIGRVWKVEGAIPALRNIGALRVSNISGFGEPIWIEAVYFNGKQLYNRSITPGRDQPKGGTPTGWSYQPPDRIFLDPILETPEPGDAFRVRAVVQPRLGDDPAITVSHVPAHILSFHSETILDGARAQLYGMPAKPWSNGTLAAFYMKKARSGYAVARIQSDDQRGTDPRPRWVFPRPGAWRRP